MSALRTSLQATGRLNMAIYGRDDNYPYRVVIMECDERDLWSVVSIFEMKTFADAEFEALSICTEPFGSGVTAMHYYIGEVA